MNDRPNPGWFARNWKWLVPSGCLTVVLLFALVVFVVVGFGIKGITGMMKSSEPVTHALRLAQGNQDVTDALGVPLETGGMISGNISTTNADGQANLQVPLKGPKGTGTIYVKGEREADRWTYSLIEVEIEADGSRVDLLEGSAPSESARPADGDGPAGEQTPDASEDGAEEGAEPTEDEAGPQQDATAMALSAAAAAARGRT